MPNAIPSAEYYTDIDVREDEILRSDPKLLRLLLADKTTGRNILWATADYSSMGLQYEEFAQILPELITGENRLLIRPRISKEKAEKADRTKNPGFPTRFFLYSKCLKPSIYKDFLSLRKFPWISLESLKIVCVAHALHTRCTRPVSGLLKGHDVSLFCATALIFYGQLSSFRSNHVAHSLASIVLSSDLGCTLFGRSHIQQTSFVCRAREVFSLSCALRCGIISSINRDFVR